MNSIALIAAAFLAQAEPHVATGTGVICDSSTQMKQYAEAVAEGADGQEVIEAINRRVGTKNACALAQVAYERVGVVDSIRVKDDLIEIVEINIIGVMTQRGWKKVESERQFVAFVANEPRA